jgi:tetratricopeptide (TPR) repeat protein
MSIARIRIVVWATALACLMLLAVMRSPRDSAKPSQAKAPAHGEPQLVLLPMESQAAPLRPVPEIVETRPSIAAVTETHRDPKLRAANVIREPESHGQAAERPSWSLDQDVVVREPTRPISPPLTPPLTNAIPEPTRVEAEIAPRAADHPSLPMETESPPPAPLAIVSRNNPAMQPVNQAAGVHVQRGFSLGERAAIYAARNEFIQALRTITQAVDAQAGLGPKDPQSCSQALVRGLNALTEADDFAPEGSQLDGDLDLAAIIAAHRTPACKKQPPTTQLAALQAYFDFARNELQRASAGSPVASQALTGLGKTYTLNTEKNPQRLALAKAMVYHQAAVAADPENHLAANELGVLLAKHGAFEAAKRSLLQSLRTQSDAAGWQNLAAIHTQLGEHDLAALAVQERSLLLRDSKPDIVSAVDGSPTVQWVEPKAFAGPPEEAQVPSHNSSEPSGNALKTAKRVTAERPALWKLLPAR